MGKSQTPIHSDSSEDERTIKLQSKRSSPMAKKKGHEDYDGDNALMKPRSMLRKATKKVSGSSVGTVEAETTVDDNDKSEKTTQVKSKKVSPADAANEYMKSQAAVAAQALKQKESK